MSLIQSITYGDLVLTDAPFLWEFGGDFGGPELVKNALAQQLQDGEIVSATRASNRTLTLTFLAEKAVGEQADAEALLVAEADKQRNTLAFDPGDGSAVTVYDTFVADLTYVRDDDKELNGFREWKLTIPASPYPRSDSQVTETIPAPPSDTPTVTSIDTCGSTTGWNAGSGTLTTGTDSTYGTYVQSAAGANPGAALTRSGLSADMTSTPYLRLKLYASMAALSRTYQINGTTVTPAASLGSLSAPGGLSVWLPFSGTLNSVSVSMLFGSSGGTLRIFDVSATDATTDSVSTLEVARQFNVAGSVRTPASISVHGVDPSDGSDSGLKQVVVYTTLAQDVATPSLRDARVDGGSDTSDSTAYSGKKSALSATHRFQIPVSAVASSGYWLPVRVQASSTGDKTLTWTAKTIVDGDTVSDVQTGTQTITIAASNTWQVSLGGLLVLPPGLAGSAGVVEVSLASTTLTLDDAWLCDRNNGRSTVVDAGDNCRVWVDSATLDSPRNLVWVGNAEDRSDAYVAGGLLFAKGAHQVAPPLVNIFVASGSPAEIGLSYYPRWHTHAGTIDTGDES